jgi:ubiquinone/menaquinone biosynthesis C-methylase UbiE
MEMSRLEKVFVNRAAKGRWNVRRLRKRLETFSLEGVRDVLEIGCGRGDVSAWLAAEVPAVRVTGVDVDPGQIDLARGVHPEGERLRFVVGDATDLPTDDASVDLVVAHHVFHHLPDWKDAVAETARVLRPGGAMLWLDLAVPAFLQAVLRPFARRSGLFTLAEVETAFASRGLRPAVRRAVRTGPLVHHDLVLRRT